MADLIKVNEIYWQCTRYFNTSTYLYRNVKVVAVDTEQEKVDFYYIENHPHKIFTCSIKVFLSNFGETGMEAFKKELAGKKNELFNLDNK